MAAALRAQPALFNKRLNYRTSREVEGGLANLGGHLQHTCGTVRFGGSWSWFGRAADHLRRVGVSILKALTEGP